MRYAFVCGNFASKPKRCLHCKRLILWGVGGGDCARNGSYTSTNGHCKYFKRSYRIFDKDGRIKNQELYNEMFM